MLVYEKLGDRFMVLLSAGNRLIPQSVREFLQVEQLAHHEGGGPINIWNAKSMFVAARVLGCAIRRIYQRAAALKVPTGIHGLDHQVQYISRTAAGYGALWRPTTSKTRSETTRAPTPLKMPTRRHTVLKENQHRRQKTDLAL